MTNRMLRAAWITLLLCLSESEKARYRKMSNDRNARRTPNDWDATRTQDDWDAARTLSYEDVPNTLYESPAANRVQYAPNVEKPTGMAGNGANIQQIPPAPFQRETGPDRIQTGPEKKRSMIPFIAAGAAVLVVIAALVFFLGSSGSKTDSSYQAGSEGSTGSKKSSGSNFAKITIVCPSSMHVGETMPIFVKAGDKVYFAASPNITWSVDNTSVAYISTEGDGALVGVSEGKVKVTAEINGITDSEVMNLHPHAVLIRVLWRWYQNLRAFLKLSVLRYLTAVPVSPFGPFPAGRTYPGLSMSPLSFGIFHSLP